MKNSEPTIIQGGMGVAISSWKLAGAVSRLGQLGVVSGTALDTVWVRRLQSGDSGGHFYRAIQTFPKPEIAERVYRKYFSATRPNSGESFARAPMLSADLTKDHRDLMVVSNFVEVYLAREGHEGSVGINYLEKIQMATLPCLYGAMLAGVGYVLMGAGIPSEIPGAMDRLARGETAELRLDVRDSKPGELFAVHFDPKDYIPSSSRSIARPKFIAIVSSSALALRLAKKATGKVDGFVIEGATAGGHNAPPRGELHLNDRGEPIYGPRDEPDLKAIRDIGLPFWLAGSFGSREGLKKALSHGATGVQLGTAFALCEESGLSSDLKTTLLAHADQEDVFTDPLASPTGFPFKVARIEGTLSEPDTYKDRTRRCDLGYLRQPFKWDDGSIGYRCPGEPVEAYVAKGGRREDTEHRKCLCNALLANIGLPQLQEGGHLEKPLVTIGDDVRAVTQFLKPGCSSYAASDVLQVILG